MDASDLDENGDGCLDDDDGDGVLNPQDDCPSTEGGAEVSEQGCSEAQLRLLDEDSDGVSDFEDVCPYTPPNTVVDAVGCVDVVEEEREEETTSGLASLFAGQNDPVRTTVSIGAVLLALFSLLQTNAVAAMLPETSDGCKCCARTPNSPRKSARSCAICSPSRKPTTTFRRSSRTNSTN